MRVLSPHPDVPLIGRVPQPNNLHITSDQEMPLLLLPSSQATAIVSDGIGIRYSAEGRGELSLSLSLVSTPNSNAAFA